MSDERSDVERAACNFLLAKLGPEAKATGAARILSDGRTGRLQTEWVNLLTGEILWMDIPHVAVDELPPRQY